MSRRGRGRAAAAARPGAPRPQESERAARASARRPRKSRAGSAGGGRAGRRGVGLGAQVKRGDRDGAGVGGERAARGPPPHRPRLPGRGTRRRSRATPASADDGRGGRGSLRWARVFVLVRGGGVRRAPGPGRPLQRAGAGLEGRPGAPGPGERSRGSRCRAGSRPPEPRAEASPAVLRALSPARAAAVTAQPGARERSPARGGWRGGTWACPPVSSATGRRGGADAQARGRRRRLGAPLPGPSGCSSEQLVPGAGEPPGGILLDSKPRKVTRPRGPNRQALFSNSPHPPALPASAATLLTLGTWRPRAATRILEGPSAHRQV